MNVILDTNVFVAAGFNPRSSSAKIIEAVRTGTIHLVWNQATKRETQRLIEQIPRLWWAQFSPLFKQEDEHPGPVNTEAFLFVEDPDDRKFAALAEATGAILVTNDMHLLAHRGRIAAPIMTPTAFVREYGGLVS